MGSLAIKSCECAYKEKDKRLEEHSINGIHDDEL